MKSTRFTRRQALALAAAGLAGCSSTPPGRQTTAQTSTATPTPTTVAPEYDTTLIHDHTAWPRYDPGWSAPTDSPELDVEIEVLVKNLSIPWDLSFAPSGDLFVTERTGRVLRYRSGEVVDVAAPRDAIDADAKPPGSDDYSWFVKGGEGGTMGVAAHPNYPSVPLVYVYYTAETADGKVNRLASFDVSADEPGRHTKVLLETPAGRIHNGGRLAFGPANYLWVTTGDAGEHDLAQDTASLAGKILRVTPEGEAAPGNPDLGSDADPRIFTYGHRNPQGITWLPHAKPAVDEHGPGPDEVSLLDAGGNYGWPAARKPEEYAGTDYQVPVASSHVERTVWAPSGSVFYTGDGVPAWRNRLLVGCLGSQRLKVFTLTPPDGTLPSLGETGVRLAADWLDDRYTVTSHTLLENELGRIRHVEQGPDGAVYAITSNRDGRAKDPYPLPRDDVLVRITPKPT